jgi:hypothetical protein
VLVTDYGYNAAGWVETVIDSKGLVGKQFYNLAGWTTKTIENYVDGTFGLTPEDVRLMWDTAPPRMPFGPPSR